VIVVTAQTGFTLRPYPEAPFSTVWSGAARLFPRCRAAPPQRGAAWWHRL